MAYGYLSNSFAIYNILELINLFLGQIGRNLKFLFEAMENFTILTREEITFNSSFIYDREAWLTANKIEFDSNCLDIPFKVIFFRNLSFDLLILSQDQTLYRINKFKKLLEPIGTITDKILAISTGNDKIVILTEKEILLFNSYFDLDRHVEVSKVIGDFRYIEEYELNYTYRIIFGDGVFTLLTPESMNILNFELSVCGIFNEKILGAIFISDYNKFACLTLSDKCIKFIEPNGLEHGEPLFDFAGNIHSLFIGNTQIILLDKKDCVEGYYQKNFFWYKKFSIKGNFYSTEDNAIIIQEEQTLFKYRVFREKSTKFVINSNNLYYTNFNRAIIPPPFYYKSIDFTSQIFCYHFELGKLICADRTGISVLSIDKMDNIKRLTFVSYEKLSLNVEYVFEILMNQSDVYLRIQSGIYRIDFETLLVKHVKSYDNTLKMVYNLGSMILFHSKGDLSYGNRLYNFNFTKKKDFDLQISNNEVFLLNDGELQYVQISNNEEMFNLIDSTTALNLSTKFRPPQTSDIANLNHQQLFYATKLYSDVSTFLIYENYLLYISKNEFCLIDRASNEKICSYAEDGLSILAIKDNSIIFSTRFGSLETVTNKLFTLKIIKKLIESQLIDEAAAKCDLNHINYSIFLGDKGFTSNLISKFNDSQALSFFNCLKIPKHRFLLECEIFERLDMNFDTLFATRDKPFEVKIEECIPIEIAKNFLIGFDFSHKLKLREADFLKNKIEILDYIDNECKMRNINSFLSSLNIERHFSTIVNVFIALDRVDLCFYLPNLQKAIKVLQTKLSPETICKASILSFDIEKIILTHKLCQRDYASFISFFNSCENRKFSVYHYLENKKLALYYLTDYNISNGLSIDEIIDYAKTNNVINCLILFTYHNIFNFSFYSYVAEYKEPLDAFYLYKNDGNLTKALEICLANLFWNESLGIDCSNQNCCQYIHLLISATRYSEAGEIVENFIKDHISSIKLYLKGRSIRKALNIYRSKELNSISEDTLTFNLNGNLFNLENEINKIDEEFCKFNSRMSKENIKELILRKCIKYSENDIALLNSLIETFVKYKNRLSHVRARLNENMNASQTTFSYSSIRSTQKALIKDRPGGVFENEFVMNKISKTVVEICQLRNDVQEILEVFEEFEDYENKNKLLGSFDSLKISLRSEVDEIWKYERTDVDINLPAIPKPMVNGYFD